MINLLTLDAPRFYDIALRDFGLMLGALALGRLALAFAGGRGAVPASADFATGPVRARQEA